jgi:hypothetical protein
MSKHGVINVHIRELQQGKYCLHHQRRLQRLRTGSATLPLVSLESCCSSVAALTCSVCEQARRHSRLQVRKRLPCATTGSWPMLLVCEAFSYCSV